MNREIKFRAWLNGRMYMNVGSLNGDAIIEELDPSYFYLQDCISSNVDLMQYTGLKDKNGVEIYEGDIVSLIESGLHEKWSTRRKVFFDFRYLGFSPFCYLDFVVRDQSIEIVGNIHENPELIDD